MKIITLMVFLMAFGLARAQYQPVALTGFTDDVIANGLGDATSSTTNSIGKADSNWALVAADFKATPTSTPPVRSLPVNGVINSSWASIPFSFQLADYSAPNSLRLTEASPVGTLTFVTPRSASGLVIGMLGSHPDPPPMSQGRPVVDIEVNFTDGSSQTVGNIALHSWYVTLNNTYAMAGIGRVSRGSSYNPLNELSGTATVPCLPMVSVSITPEHYGKLIKSITVKRPASIDMGVGAGAVVHVLAVSAKAVCAVPDNQPTALTFTPALNSLSGTFTAAVGNPSNYLVVRYPSGAVVTPPDNYTLYTVGQTLGAGTVVATLAAPNTSFTSSGLNAGTAYDFYVYAYNTGSACGGPTYLLTAPLKGAGTTIACTGGSGIISVGPGGAYTTLTDALSVINVNGVGITGSAVLELKADYTSTNEVFPIIIKDNGCYSASRTLSIRPASGANGLTIIGNNAGPTIALASASYVEIDGTPGGSTEASTIAVTPSGSYNPKNLNIINTNDNGVAVMIDTNSTNNTIKFCDLQGQNNIVSEGPQIAGVVYIGNGGAKASEGNDNINIDHCNIHATAAATLPSRGIYVKGFANTLRRLDPRFNDSGTISNNNIYDFFNPSANSTGLELVEGVNAWTISGNSFFQTQVQSYKAGAKHKVIRIATQEVVPGVANSSVGNGFIISGNYIGGSAPGCAGAPYAVNGAYITTMEGIRLDVADASDRRTVSDPFPTVPSSVQGNVIQNISFISGAAGTSSSITEVFHGIVCQNSGRVHIGNVMGNTIGSVTRNESIVIGGGRYSGANGITLNNLLTSRVSLPPAPGFLVQNNKIGGMKIVEVGTIAGIYVGMPAGLPLNSGAANQVLTIDSNIIGSLTLPNSIIAANTGGGLPSIAGGILISPEVALGSLNIRHNKIANITNNSTADSNAYLFGISIGYNKTSTSVSLNAIAGNSVRRLHTASRTVSNSANVPGLQHAVIGIHANTTKAVATDMSNNIIDSLVADANTGVKVAGLFFNGAATVKHTISKNLIHSLDVSAGNAASALTGIYYQEGSADVSNNMVRVGIKPNGKAIVAPAAINGILSASGATNNFYFNSVYIGGSGVGAAGAQNTHAFTRTAATGVYDIRNNIFVNNRSNASTGGKHYAISFTAANAGASPNYNVYYTKGTGGVFGYDGAKDVAVYDAGWLSSDVNSRSLDPQFINPDGDGASGDLHISTSIATPVEGAGISLSGITDDFDGDNRTALSPVDIGADAGNFLKPSVNISGSVAVCVGSTLSLTASSGLPNPTYTWTGPNNFSAIGTTINIANVTAGNAGTYTLTASSGSADYTAITTVTVAELPVISIKNNGPLCTGKELQLTVTATGTGTIGYQWSGPNGFSSLQQNPVRNSLALADAGKYKVTVTAGACTVSDSTIVAINQSPSIQSISANDPLCENDQLNLLVTAAGGRTLAYQWTGPNGYSTTEQNPSKNNMTFSDSGRYSITVSDSLCSVSDSLTVVIKSRPQISSIDNNGPLCAGDSLHLSAVAGKGTGQIVYEWSGPDGFSALGQEIDRQGVTVRDSGMYLLKVMDDYCSAIDSTLVVVQSIAKPVVTYADYTLRTGTYDVYQWLKNGDIIAGATTATYTVTSNGEYQVVVANIKGCTDTSLVQKVADYVGINKISAIAAAIRIYPNPATEVIYVQSPFRVAATLRNVDGRFIRSIADITELSLKDLAAGMYLLTLTDQDGNLIKVEKVIKKK